MSKSILDHSDTSAEGSRVAQFSQIDRAKGAEGPSAATKALQRRAREEPGDAQRAAEFLEIEKGRKA